MTHAKVGGDDAIAAGVDLTTLPREELGSLEPTQTTVGDDLVLSWPAYKVSIALSRLHEGRDGITSELVVASDIHGEIHWGRLNLLSTPARAGLVKTLVEAAARAPWALLLERACRLAALHLRAGSPVICLMPRRAPATRHLIAKLVLANETNVLFGDGGSGKSLLALSLAVAASTGQALPGGLVPAAAAVRVLYIDYESCVEEHEDRLAGLLAGLGIREAPPILYRQMIRPLADDAAVLRAEISTHKVGFVIVDSLAPACGAEPEGADAAVRAFSALRSLGVSRLVVAHVSKVMADQRAGASRPFGSVFVQNLARNVGEVRKAEDDGDDALVIAVNHRKFNGGRLFPPFCLRFEVKPDATTLHGHDIGKHADLLARTSLTFRIKKALTAGARSVPELMEETGGTKDTIDRTLRRWREKGTVIRVDDGRWGLRK
jgi:hypothetical protein